MYCQKVATRVGVYGYCSNATEAICGISRLAAVEKYHKTVKAKDITKREDDLPNKEKRIMT